MDKRSITSAQNGKKRKKASHTIEAAEARKIAIAMVAAKIEPLMQVLIDKGLDGDVPSIKEAFDRAFGKSMQAIDHTTDGKPMPQPIYANLSVSKHDSN